MQLFDLVDATPLPVFSTEEAIESMQRIVDKTDDIEKEEREEIIMAFISALLFFIPIAGQTVGAIGGTTLRAILASIGVAGEAGLAIYSVIQDLSSAVMAVFFFLAGAGVGRGGFSRAAGSWRGMGQNEFDSLGNVKTSLNKVQDIKGGICLL